MIYRRYRTILEVKWCDAKSFSEWLGDDEIDKKIDDPEVCYSMGYFVRKTRKHLCITSTYTDDKDSRDGGLLKIPHGCIIRVKEVKRERSKRKRRNR